MTYNPDKIISALDRQANALEREALRLAQQSNYGAEIPENDAEMLRQAKAIVEQYASDYGKFRAPGTKGL